MKKMTKRIVGVAFSAALAFTVGAGVYSVYDAQSVIKADAEATITIDMTEAIYSNDWGTCNDYTEAGLYRLFLGGDKTKAWVTGGVCLNENGNSHLLDYIKINGKTIAEHRAEYGAKLANGETSPITWTGMPANEGATSGSGRYMQPNIADEVLNGPVLDTVDAYYAPIFINLAYHGETYGNAIDMYIPTSYLSEVTSIELSKDFTWTNGTDTWGITQDIKWIQNSYGGGKVMGERTVIETSVTGVNGSYGAADKHLDFFLSTHDYDTNTAMKAVDKGLLASLNYYDYILLDGEKLGALTKTSGQREVYINAWYKNSFGTRWPEWMREQGLVDSVQEITILAGCQFPSYTDPNTVYETTEDVTFVRQESGAFADPNALMYPEEFTVSWALTDGVDDELYRVEIVSDGWEMKPYQAEGQPQPDAFDFNYYDDGARDIIRKSILLNGKSIYEINTTVDDSGYVYSTYPMTLGNKSNSGYDVFANPILLEARGNKLIVYIHKDYMTSQCSAFGDSMVVTVKPNIMGSDKVAGKILAEDIVAEIYAVGYDLTLMDGNKEVEVLSIKAGNPLNNLPEATADHLVFVAWVDAEGNPAPAVMPADVLTLYAKWKPIPYTATVIQMDGSEESFVFGMMRDEENGVPYSADEMADVINACLPEKTATEGYGFVERVPNDFQLRDYTFTVTSVQILFTITFTDADGNDIGVAPITFTEESIDSLVLPEVPAKEGYTGKWNKTVDRLKLEDVTLYAIYTEVQDVPELPDSSSGETSDEDSSDDSVAEPDSSNADAQDSQSKGGIAGMLAGCSGIIGGVASGLTALGIAAVALLKKKED